MAGDWIKIEHTTPDKPEVISISGILRIDPDAVTGKLIRVWIWADQNSIDGDDIKVSDIFIDRLTHQKGFAFAMRQVGWLDEKDGRLIFPGFTRHNGETAKARADSNRRMQKTRQNRNMRCGNVAEKTQQKPQPEKRREEKNREEREREESTAPALPPAFEILPTGSARNLLAIQSKIQSLKPSWTLALTYEEQQNLMRNGSCLDSLQNEDWERIKRYLAAKMPEGSPYWQPRNRSKFIESIADVHGHACEWEQKHGSTNGMKRGFA